ncbi:hypothetical protein KIPB_011671, partial [Kipferlia bialata]
NASELLASGLIDTLLCTFSGYTRQDWGAHTQDVRVGVLFECLASVCCIDSLRAYILRPTAKDVPGFVTTVRNKYGAPDVRCNPSLYVDAEEMDGIVKVLYNLTLSSNDSLFVEIDDLCIGSTVTHWLTDSGVYLDDEANHTCALVLVNLAGRSALLAPFFETEADLSSIRRMVESLVESGQTESHIPLMPSEDAAVCMGLLASSLPFRVACAAMAIWSHSRNPANRALFSVQAMLTVIDKCSALWTETGDSSELSAAWIVFALKDLVSDSQCRTETLANVTNVRYEILYYCHTPSLDVGISSTV